MLKIIISPAKKMSPNDEVIDWEQLPIFATRATELRNHLRELSYSELRSLWQCNDKIAQINYERLQKMSLNSNLTPAVLAYEGLQYQYMAPHVFDKNQWNYVREHLIILSGFYGLLRATDGVTPYRLEMQAKLQVNDCKNLYDYWKSFIYNALVTDCSVIVNLASKEYSKVIEKYLDDKVRILTCVFGEKTCVNGVKKVKTKATAAKMARGEMVRFMAETNVQDARQLKEFDRLLYVYCEEYSSDENYVFVKVDEK